jgi:hypothetical protein
MVQAVKSIPMPTTSAGSTPLAREHLGHGALEDLDVVVRVLERPVGRQRSGAAGQPFVDDAVAVRVYGAGDRRSVADAHEQRASGLGAVVDADGVHVRSRSPRERGAPLRRRR